MINYQEIVENLSTEKIIQLMTTLGAEDYIEKQGYVIFPTICHNEDPSEASMKLYYYENSHLFLCYTECGALTIFQFLKNYYETRGIEYDWYSDIYQVILDCSNFNLIDSFKTTKYKSQKDKYVQKEVPILPTYPNGILDCFIKFYPPEWLYDGISKATMDKFNICFSSIQNKIIIPHYNINGELVGIRGRALDEWEIENIGKYMPVKLENKWYSHPLSLNLYGLNITKENIKRTGICYIFESEKSVMQCDDFKMDNCAVAVCGSQLNKWQIKILIKECHPQEIVLCFDKEEIPPDDNYFNKLYKLCSKYKNYANFSFIYDRMKLLDMKDSPSDKGEEVFQKLLSKRVKVK